MRLSELNPKWIQLNNWSSPSIFYIGISFDCPHCNPNLPEHGENRKRRLAVKFFPPIDPDKLLGKMFDLPNLNYHNRISGENFENLTIAPSIGFESIGHWHGNITNGSII